MYLETRTPDRIAYDEMEAAFTAKFAAGPDASPFLASLPEVRSTGWRRAAGLIDPPRPVRVVA